MATVLITSRVVGVTLTSPMEMLKAAKIEIAENPYLQMEKPLGEDQLCELVKGVDGIIVGDDEVTEKVMQYGDCLKVISKNGVGVNRIDVRAATNMGIVVTNTPGANYDAVADLTIGLMLAAARRIPHAHIATKEGKWERHVGVEVWRKTIGIVGVGHVGRAVARRATGFEMRILGYDVTQDEELAQLVRLTYVPLETIFREADFVTLHLPLTEHTLGIVTRQHLRMMKRTAYLVNIARGGIVRSADLYEALVANELAGAAVDVFEEEPPIGDRLLRLDNVVATPHIGAFTWEALKAMGNMAAQNIIDVIQGRAPTFAVNPEVLSTIRR